MLSATRLVDHGGCQELDQMDQLPTRSLVDLSLVGLKGPGIGPDRFPHWQ